MRKKAFFLTNGYFNGPNCFIYWFFLLSREEMKKHCGMIKGNELGSSRSYTLLRNLKFDSELYT